MLAFGWYLKQIYANKNAQNTSKNYLHRPSGYFFHLQTLDIMSHHQKWLIICFIKPLKVSLMAFVPLQPRCHFEGKARLRSVCEDDASNLRSLQLERRFSHGAAAQNHQWFQSPTLTFGDFWIFWDIYGYFGSPIFSDTQHDFR